MRRTLATAAVTAALAAPATAQEDVSFLDIFHPDLLIQSLVQVGVVALRTVVDVTYSSMDVQALAGRVSLTDVELYPFPPWDEDRMCRVNADRMTLRGSPFGVVDEVRMRIQLSGITATSECIPPDQRPMLTGIGVSEIDVPVMSINIA